MALEKLVGPFPAGENPNAYDQIRRQVLWKMPSGLYLLGSRSGARRNFMTCNWVSQVGVEPKLVAVSVERVAHSHELVHEGGSFSICLLDRADRALVRKFVKPATDDGKGNLNGFAYRNSRVTGAPVLEQAVAYLDCSLTREVDCGSHTLFIGEVVDAGFTAADSEAFEAVEVLGMQDTRMSYGG